MSRKRKTQTEDSEKVYVEHPRWGSRPRLTGLSVPFEPPEQMPHWRGVRCHPCRRRTRELRALNERYQALLGQVDPSPDQEAELALVRMELLEAAFFGPKQIDAVRAFLRRHAEHPRAGEIRERLARLEQR